jgi:hypothetical protein
MSKHLTSILTFALSLFIGASAFAAPLLAANPGGEPLVQTVDADCYAVGEDKAAELGGTLAKAKPAMDGETPVCQLVIVVPGQDGERPKRVELVVPQ